MNDQITVEETNQKLKFPVGAIFLILSQILVLTPFFRNVPRMNTLLDLFFSISLLAIGVLLLCKKHTLIAFPLIFAGYAQCVVLAHFLYPCFSNAYYFIGYEIVVSRFINIQWLTTFLEYISNFLLIWTVILLAFSEFYIKNLKKHKKIFLYILYASFAAFILYRISSLVIDIKMGYGIDSNFILYTVLYPIGLLLLGIYFANPYKKIAAPKVSQASKTTKVVGDENVVVDKAVISDEYYISLGKHICLLLFTFGIWNFMWIYKITRYTNIAKGEEERDPTKKLLLCMFVPFYSIYWTYKTSLRVDSIAKERGVASDLGTICLILAIFVGFVPPILLQEKINAILTAPEASERKSDTTDTVEALKQYKELLDHGIITQEEFDAKKKEILGL